MWLSPEINRGRAIYGIPRVEREASVGAALLFCGVTCKWVYDSMLSITSVQSFPLYLIRPAMASAMVTTLPLISSS